MIQASLPCTNIFLRPSVTCSNHQQKKVICQDVLDFYTILLEFYFSIFEGVGICTYIYIYIQIIYKYVSIYSLLFLPSDQQWKPSSPLDHPSSVRCANAWKRSEYDGSISAHVVRTASGCHGVAMAAAAVRCFNAKGSATEL